MHPVTEKSDPLATASTTSDPQIYPNPTTGLVTLNYPQDAGHPGFLELRDAAGRLVKHWTSEQIAERTDSGFILDLTMLPAGIYTLKCQFRDSIRNLKLVISN